MLKDLETTEPQILGALLKMKNGIFQDGEKDLADIARKTKATVNSLQWKFQNLKRTIESDRRK